MAFGSRTLLRAGHQLPRAYSLPPPFLLPSIYQPHTRSFHSSPTHQKRESNKKRGLSALRRSGLRKGLTLSVKAENLPRPVLDPALRSKIHVDPDHGLYKFFRSDEVSISTPELTGEHGRSWTVEELRAKGFEDLHKLWWVCVKERNLIATEEAERRRIRAGYGQAEAEGRDEVVKTTMRAIKHTLTERWYTWENAREIAKQDSTIRLEPGLEKAYLSPEELALLQDAEYADSDEDWRGQKEGLLEETPPPSQTIGEPQTIAATPSTKAP